MNVFKDLIEARSSGNPCALYSVCCAHQIVLDAALTRAAKTKHPVLIEATANQVNQYGGYMGMTPQDFGKKLRQTAAAAGVPEGLFIYGGDHLGPFPWRQKKAKAAMSDAVALVKAFVAGGATKIHLDASMRLADDPPGALNPATAADRAAELCFAGEEEFLSQKKANTKTAPVYVIGTEVPVPGGTAAQEKNAAPTPTTPEAFHTTIRLHHEAFMRKGLNSVWSRVIAVVVQPGVEFNAMRIYPYHREKAKNLMNALHAYPSLVLEGHSTDYQQEKALRMLVEDGIGILKVGPALTFAMREALFGLSYIDAELSGHTGKPDLIISLEKTMELFPQAWQHYYENNDRIALLFGYSDRIRYYWTDPMVISSTDKLMKSLSKKKIPLQLLSQYIPHLKPELLKSYTDIKKIPSIVVDSELEKYERACFTNSVLTYDT